jgi:hypothetical protein
MTMHSSEQPEPSYADQLREHFSAARYRSTTMKVGRTVARALAAGQIAPQDVEPILQAAHFRRAALSYHSNHAEPTLDDLPAQHQLAVTEKPWSPSGGILDTMNIDREPDHMERQLPNGDRD